VSFFSHIFVTITNYFGTPLSNATLSHAILFETLVLGFLDLILEYLMLSNSLSRTENSLRRIGTALRLLMKSSPDAIFVFPLKVRQKNIENFVLVLRLKLTLNWTTTFFQEQMANFLDKRMKTKTYFSITNEN
jgi:hypothetical protein